MAADERLHAAQTEAMCVQHVFAMFGATVLAPSLMGFEPNLAIFMSGIGTLMFFVLVGGACTSYLCVGGQFCIYRTGDRRDGVRRPGP